MSMWDKKQSQIDNCPLKSMSMDINQSSRKKVLKRVFLISNSLAIGPLGEEKNAKNEGLLVNQQKDLRWSEMSDWKYSIKDY